MRRASCMMIQEIANRLGGDTRHERDLFGRVAGDEFFERRVVFRALADEGFVG